jgi:hypothetical protein
VASWLFTIRHLAISPQLIIQVVGSGVFSFAQGVTTEGLQLIAD